MCKNLKKWIEEKWPWIASFLITALFIICFIWYCFSGSKLPSNFGQIGDSFAGLFTSIAFIWLIYSTFQTSESLKKHQQELEIQKQDRDNQLEIMKQQKEEFEESVKISKKQLFWKTYKNVSDNVVAMLTTLKKANAAEVFFHKQVMPFDKGGNSTGGWTEGHKDKDRLMFEIALEINSDVFAKRFEQLDEKSKVTFIDWFERIESLFSIAEGDFGLPNEAITVVMDEDGNNSVGNVERNFSYDMTALGNVCIAIRIFLMRYNKDATSVNG